MQFTYDWDVEIGTECHRRVGRPRRRMLKCIINKCRLDVTECVDWFRLAPDRSRWLAVVATVVVFRVPKRVGHILTGLPK